MRGQGGIKGISLTAAVIAVTAVLLFFRSSATVGKSAPVIPSDIFHDSVMTSAACVTCHTPGRQVPLKATHPAETDCFSCHRTRTMR